MIFSFFSVIMGEIVFFQNLFYMIFVIITEVSLFFVFPINHSFPFLVLMGTDFILNINFIIFFIYF